MNTITIKNSKLTAKISPLGAQLLSLCDEKREYMWQTDPDVWNFTAPVLFPICGKLNNDSYTYKGKTYEMGNHGFARFLEYEAEELTDSKVCFLAKSDENTKKSYPFDFEFRVIFELTENKLNITYSVTNPSQENIYFSFGGHEGYACEEGAGEYHILFEKDTALTRHMLTDSCFDGKTEEITLTDGKLMLDYKEFEKCTYVFRNIKSDSVIFSKNDGTNKIRIGFPGHNVLAVWTLTDRKYVCIEPWCGVSEVKGFNGELSEKDGIISLEPKATFAKTHYIEVL